MKLTKAKLNILGRMCTADGDRDLVNGDECLPSWWVEDGFAVNGNAAKSLSRSTFVQYYRHEGGQPGVDRFRVTDAGRLALKENSNG